MKSAEASLRRLSEVFHYQPSDKIIINTYDVNDYGAGSATSVPRNYIWLDISPLEPGYENIPYNERIQWLLSHELVHIVVNDLGTNTEAFNRSIFSKVAPEQVQPLSIFYSVLTNYSRYTPRWHQEGIAVFLETWLSGGFGRTMGSFDEMYFRSLVLDGKEFPTDILLETQVPHTSFLVETNYYMYGERFVTHLVLKYGPEKLLQWYTASPNDFYVSFTQKFEKIFGIDFQTGWGEFVQSEKAFQEANIARLNSAPITEIIRLTDRPMGAVAQPHVDAVGRNVYWGEHRPHHLAAIQKLDLLSLTSEEISTLPTPSMHQVTSTAFDAETGMFFFTTKNNQLYRDVWVLDVQTEKKRLLFENARVGHLTVSSATHELWGIRQSGGASTLVGAQSPYDTLKEFIHFDIGDEVQGLAVSCSGERLAAVLHKANGDQAIVLSDCNKIRSGLPTTYAVVTDKGSPENPSWAPDDKTLYWDAYTNGVANIYKKNIDSSTIQAVTHTLSGLFKPIYLNEDSLFAFEFSSEGFYPVIIPNGLAERLPAMKYLGTQVYEAYPRVLDLSLKPSAITDTTSRTHLLDNEYNGFDHLNVVSFIPVMTGFQSKKVLGFFAHISDPILNHDLIIETGLSPFHELSQPLQFHLKLKYDYQKEFEFGWDYNGTDFYDLFNKRKRGTIGSKIRLGNTHYWIYDNPQKLKQLSEIALYTGYEFISDNLVRVSQPDFFVAQTGINSQSLRRTIGSSDFEQGNEYAVTSMFFGSDPQNLQLGIQVYAEWDHYTTYAALHNVFHFKIAAGYHRINDRLRQSRFYFGGFGNRAIENVDAKQFRKVFRFPGVPIYSYAADRFAKFTVENDFPPIRFHDVSFGQHFFNHIDLSTFSQMLLTNTQTWFGVDLGLQANLVIKHWFNLESTLSAGVARAWVQGIPSDEWFVSYKLLRN